MGKNIVLFTRAYNAERTIEYTIESVLNQTYQDFTYYCHDNGSTDGTWQIIREKSSKDSRIVPWRTEQNLTAYNMEVSKPEWQRQQAEILQRGTDGYIAFLDADDEYAPGFLEKMLTFTEENDLEMALCGTEYVDEDGFSRADVPPETRILAGHEKAVHLPEYYKYATRYWAVLFSLSLLPTVFFHADAISGDNLKKICAEKKPGAAFFDVIRTLNAVRQAGRIGILPESLHKYYASPAQLSASYNPNWFLWVNIMQEHLRDFILSFGPISRENENFLSIRFFIWLDYILPRLQNADAPVETRVRDMAEIFSDTRVKKWLALDWESIGIKTDKPEFLERQLAWAKSQAGIGRNSDTLISVIEQRIAENRASD